MLRIALVARNPFALDRAKQEFLAAHQGAARPLGHSNCCKIVLEDVTEVSLLDETTWWCCRYALEPFDQIFVVDGAALGIDFTLALQESLKGSQVPEGWQWQKWRGNNAEH